MCLDKSVWKRTWNRFVDSYSGDDETRYEVLNIERRIFCTIKPIVEALNGEWRGLKIQNSTADNKIAEAIMNSFKSYEEGKQRKGQFFNFRRL